MKKENGESLQKHLEINSYKRLCLEVYKNTECNKDKIIIEQNNDMKILEKIINEK